MKTFFLSSPGSLLSDLPRCAFNHVLCSGNGPELLEKSDINMVDKSRFRLKVNVQKVKRKAKKTGKCKKLSKLQFFLVALAFVNYCSLRQVTSNEKFLLRCKITLHYFMLFIHFVRRNEFKILAQLNRLNLFC